MSALTLDGDSIMAHLDAWGVVTGNILIADATYAFPLQATVEGDFADMARPYLLQNVGDWTKEEGDCDDFAEECATLAHRMHRKTLARPRETALAFGEFWYTTTAGGGHAINVYMCLENGVWRLRFFEPQGCVSVRLTPEEIGSCQMLRF